MKESTKELVKECIDYCDLIALLIDLDNHFSNIIDNNNSDIVFNYYNDKWEFWPDINKLSLNELKEFVNELENQFVLQVLGLGDSVKRKLYEELNMQSGT
jgi:hypothetical protein